MARREQDWVEADRRVWDRFRPRLEALTSFPEALELVKEAPPADSPGRRYYSNLGFFLQAFTVPEGSSYAEKELHLRFIERLRRFEPVKASQTFCRSVQATNPQKVLGASKEAKAMRFAVQPNG